MNPQELRFENALKRLRLRAEFGVRLDEAPEACPVREAEWLDRLTNLEQEYAHLNLVPLQVFIGNPREFPNANRITRQDMPEMLKQLRNYLRQYDIAVEAHDQVDDRRLYRFITEELFFEEIPRRIAPGTLRRFRYEDYHPNYELEVRGVVEDFWEKVLGRFWKIVEGQLESRVQTFQPTPLHREHVIRKLRNWVEQHEEIHLMDIAFEKVHIDIQSATAAVKLQLECFPSHNPHPVRKEVFANFQLSGEKNGVWVIHGLFLPKLFS